jgi:hypothetical protein
MGAVRPEAVIRAGRKSGALVRAPVPFAVAEIQARLFELLPSPPLTTSQVDLLRVDNLASGALPGFRDLNIWPQAVEDIVPTYVVGRLRTP